MEWPGSGAWDRLSRLVRDGPSDSRAADPRQWAAKMIGGGLLVAGSILVTGITTLSYARHGVAPTPDTRPIDYVLCVPTLILGITLLTMRRPVPSWLMNVTPSLSAMLICVPTSVDAHPGPLGPLLLTWPVVFAAAVLSGRVAWATLGVVAGAFAVLSAASRGVDGIILWLEVTLAITVVCMMVVGLRRQGLKLRAELADLAVTDPLTGLANRRGFDEAMDRESQRHLRDGRPLALLTLDIDHFKRVNDTWGHQAGDSTLQALGRLLSARVRVTDSTGRIGGEEFAVLAPDCTAGQALALARTLCEAVRAESRSWEHEITVSIGVSAIPDTASTPLELHRSADAALYRAKSAGRDRALAARRSEAQPAGGYSAK